MSQFMKLMLVMLLPFFGLSAEQAQAPDGKSVAATQSPSQTNDDEDDDVIEDDDEDGESNDSNSGDEDDSDEGNQNNEPENEDDDEDTAAAPFFDKSSPSDPKSSFKGEGNVSEGADDVGGPSSLAQKKKVSVDMGVVFFASPYVYSLLFGISLFSLSLFIYTLMGLNAQLKTGQSGLQNLRARLQRGEFDEVQAFCKEKSGILFGMLSTALSFRKEGWQAMRETMRAEGRRASLTFWQRISLLNEMAIVAPMVGLLGTVLGMFYAFYDLNRSRDSMGTLFDGLGISVGTTVAGLVVAILSMGLHLMMKHRLVKTLSHVEQEAESLIALTQEANR